MQFVAASKLRRAQESTLAARPYSELLDEILADLAAVLGGDEHPLLSRREEGKRLMVLVTSDRGLAGPLNTNVIRFISKEIVEHEGDLELVSVGRKGRDAMRRARVPIIAHFPGFGDRPSFDDILPLARLISDEYEAGTYSQVDIVFTRFVSTLVQRADMVQLLPIKPNTDTEPGPSGSRFAGIPGSQFIFEPAPEVVLEELLPRYVGTRLYQTALESTASFFSSQMVAMKNATENADELIEDLTLSYNKARQANITRELIEIASGAQAR
jgi:F-type H+-transporting ATPase subunit gamma